MKIVTIVGARPQFIKAASVSRAISKYNQRNSQDKINEIIVHTGQHYDDNMSLVFFQELQIPEPVYNLGIGSSTHGRMTGLMLGKIEEVLFNEKPDLLVTYGDTNSTLAGALAASKLNIPIAHVEAGLRSFNRQMPEEINRVLTDHLSSQLFCPTDLSVENLKKEGITNGLFKVGDVMFDSFIFNRQLAEERSRILTELGLRPKDYCLVTVHRQENTDDKKRLLNIFYALKRLANPSSPFVIPLHPRTQKIIKELNNKDLVFDDSIRITKPVPYLDMIMLETHAKVILTDSGGVQKEAYFSRVPCITLRHETEWVELVEHGYNIIAGNNTDDICHAFNAMVGKSISGNLNLYGGGRASENIVKIMYEEANK